VKSRDFVVLGLYDAQWKVSWIFFLSVFCSASPSRVDVCRFFSLAPAFFGAGDLWICLGYRVYILDSCHVVSIKLIFTFFSLAPDRSHINTPADVISETMGRILDPTLALLNHSCNPNAALIYDGNVVHLRSIRDMQTSMGQHIKPSFPVQTRTKIPKSYRFCWPPGRT
jgi:hypothetical protein